MLAGNRLQCVDGNKVTVAAVADGKQTVLNADYVLLAAGQRIDREAVRNFEDSFDRVVILGESRRLPGRIATSIADGYIEAPGFNPEA